MPGKKKVREVTSRWSVTVNFTDGGSVDIIMTGAECPLATLMNVDKVERDYVLRQIAGQEIEGVTFEKIS